MNDPLRNISDTAIWVAMYRARENERSKPLFRDPYARRLAGDRGEQILRLFENQDRNEWAFNVRTFLFDSFIRERIAGGVDLIVNLAAGLDARPYRMDLPPQLQWVDVDLPEIIDYKQRVLTGEMPRCRLEYVALDLADADSRRGLFDRLAATSKQALILSEGLLIFLPGDGPQRLAEDLSATPAFRWWVFDIASPMLLKMMKKQVGETLDRANASLEFAPAEGPWYFEPFGWRVVEARGSLKHAARVMKLPFLPRLISYLPENRRGVWGGVCLLENTR